MADFHCNSKYLYDKIFEMQEYGILDSHKILSCKRNFGKFYDPMNSKYLKIFQENLELGAITYPVK